MIHPSFLHVHILLMLKLDDKHVYPNRPQIVHALASWVQFIGPFFEGPHHLKVQTPIFLFDGFFILDVTFSDFLPRR